jgi:hypothetical protein
VYKSVFRLALELALELLHPYVVIIIVLLGAGAVWGRSVSGDLSKVIDRFVVGVFKAVCRGLAVYLPWSMRAGRAGALKILRGNPQPGAAPRPAPRRWKVDLLGFLLTLLIWGATYVALFVPWVPVGAIPSSLSPFPPSGAPVSPPPSGGGASAPSRGAPTAQRLAREMVDMLNQALLRGMGGVEFSPRGYSRAAVDGAIKLLNDPVKAAAAGLPTDVEVSRSTRLNGFLRVTPAGGATGPIQDLL